MKKPEKVQPKLSIGERIKLQINSRTIVIVRTKEALKMWMTRHPEAKIIA
ncbi:MAG TPA: hypothetical protein VK826_06720 [Bacteroidia bacterium]|nr:hypothetical protein [Bacteroidia bacterium]